MEQYKDIDRIVLFSTDGIIKADMPAAGVVGQFRIDKQWFKEFSKTHKPYLSGIYQREAKPKKDVVSIILPVISKQKSQNKKDRENVVAILQVQLNKEIFHAWAHINVGHNGLIYIFDQYGHIVHHSLYENPSKVIDYSNVGIVRKTLNGQNGVEINYNPVDKEQRLSAHQYITEYGWGVVVAQPVESAFAERNKTLTIFFIIYSLIIIISFILSLTILYILINQKAVEEKMKELSLSDELTGLHNRRGFMTFARQMLITADRLKQNLFLVYIDIDKMKFINDTLGHEEGDLALTDTTQVLREVFRESDIKARIGGDEFAILGVHTEGFDIKTIGDRLQQTLSLFIKNNIRNFKLSFSSGIVLYDPQKPCTLNELMKNGDNLMYKHKTNRQT